MLLARLILHKLLSTLALLVGASLIIFVLLRLAPGDPVELMLGPTDLEVGAQHVSEQRIHEVRTELGLDRSLPEQYLAWLTHVTQLDVGVSFRSRQPVASELARRIPATAMLACAALIVQVSIAASLGILSAVYANHWIDHLTRLLAAVLSATPGFLLGLLLLLLFGAKLQWFMISGPAHLPRLLLPALTLGILTAPPLMRVLRASLLQELGRLYIVFGQAKGLSTAQLVVRHALPNAMLPVVTLLGMNLTGLLSGTVIIETIFTWPGVGRYAVESILARDYPVVQGYVLLVTTIVIAVNALIDLSYLLFDPRVRLAWRST